MLHSIVSWLNNLLWWLCTLLFLLHRFNINGREHCEDQLYIYPKSCKLNVFQQTQKVIPVCKCKYANIVACFFLAWAMLKRLIEKIFSCMSNVWCTVWSGSISRSHLDEIFISWWRNSNSNNKGKFRCWLRERVIWFCFAVLLRTSLISSYHAHLIVGSLNSDLD